jgi:hypothetical protein
MQIGVSHTFPLDVPFSNGNLILNAGLRVAVRYK